MLAFNKHVSCSQLTKQDRGQTIIYVCFWGGGHGQFGKDGKRQKENGSIKKRLAVKKCPDMG